MVVKNLLTLIDTIPSSPILFRFLPQHMQGWYILAEHDWYIHVELLTYGPYPLHKVGLKLFRIQSRKHASERII